MRVQEGARQLRVLDVRVVAQAWQRDCGDAKLGELLAGVHGVVLAAGQGYRGLGSCQQLRHIRCPDGERGWIHGQPPPAVLLPQAGIYGWPACVCQAGQARDAQVAGRCLVTRGEPGRRPACQGPGTVQFIVGPRG
jgi:hypothetical protein